jgi:hypothetical protein
LPSSTVDLTIGFEEDFAMPNRREFLGLIGLVALKRGLSAGLPAPVLSGRVPVTATECGGLIPQTPQAKGFGSGYFGEWFTDEFGLPAYRYNCNQLEDSKAITPVHKEWRSPADHTHQVGNDRLVAAVSNYGYIQVRQDEGSPKFLNDYAPERGRLGAGIGFLTDGKLILSTYYPGNADTFARIFGAGYFRKTVRGAGYEIDQVILAPFGDDPVLISQVRITNHTAATARLRWIEYWGCHPYQFSYRSFMESPSQGSPTRTAELRRRFADRFSHRFSQLPGGLGLIEKKEFLGRTPEEERAWQRINAFLKTNPNTFIGGPVPELAPGADFEDLNPPATFLASLDGPLDGFATDAAAFFGAGGVSRPTGATAPLSRDLATGGPNAALLAERTLELPPGGERTVYFIYGYLPNGFEIEPLLARYRNNPSSHWPRSSAAWKSDGSRLSVPSEPWVERETAWHNYYLRSALTYDDFFGEHILSQGNIYQYVMGFQGAARDPLQHGLPFIFSQPEFVKETLRYTLKEIQPDGSIPYGIVGHGVPMPVIYRPSDLEMWLLWVASEYVLASRDRAFLDEKISSYPSGQGGQDHQTVRELLARSYRHLVESIGAGEHGLMRLSNGDWNDSVVVGNIPPALHEEIRQKAESVLNAAMACYVLDHYGRLLDFAGSKLLAADARAKAEAQRQAVRAQWTGQWFRRAWLGQHMGWIGENQIWLEPQPWAIIGGGATPERSRSLAAALDKLVRRPSPIGAMLHAEQIAQMGRPAGVLTNGGIWPSINGTLIWALALVDPAMAWDEWKKNSLAAHAEAYPEVWYGIWSGPDSYNSTLSRHPGQTMFAGTGTGDRPALDFGFNWTDFPVMNMHPHAWPLYTAVKLIGLEFHQTGLKLGPGLPLGEYEFISPLLGFKKTSKGYSGWYGPSEAGRWTIELELSKADLARFKRIEVNGSTQPLKNPGGTSVRFQAAIRPASRSGGP